MEIILVKEKLDLILLLNVFVAWMEKQIYED